MTPGEVRGQMPGGKGKGEQGSYGRKLVGVWELEARRAGEKPASPASAVEQRGRERCREEAGDRGRIRGQRNEEEEGERLGFRVFGSCELGVLPEAGTGGRELGQLGLRARVSPSYGKAAQGPGSPSDSHLKHERRTVFAGNGFGCK